MSLKLLANQIHLSFSGSGYLLVYHLGAAKCLMDKGGQLMKKINCFAGASGGAVVAAVLGVAPEKLNVVFHTTMDQAMKVQKLPMGILTPGFKIIDLLEQFLNQELPQHAHVAASHKVFISMTVLKKMQNLLVSDFQSREEFIGSILCSCFIPFYCGMKFPIYHNMVCIDGGYSCNLPQLPSGRTIVVTPFSGEKDISPKDEGDFQKIKFRSQIFNVNKKNAERLKTALFPDSIATLENHYEAGYQDAMQFLENEGLLKKL